MIADRTSSYQQSGTLTGDTVKMSFDENSLVHLMSVMTDLYSDPELAVIREYSTNALDAHIEAGVRAPIDITLPSNLAPFFRVRDYGVGLSLEDIHAIYSKYGASTKRGTNTQVGMLGLGCKSALTYADQFTLVSRKDGERITVAISRNAEGAGEMTVVERIATDESNGTEVVVPAKRVNNFAQKAAEFFQVWKGGTVRVNGIQPKAKDGLWLTDKLLVSKFEYGQSRSSRMHRVVMGNVAYPAEHLNVPFGSGYVVTAFVDIGKVNFTPSREALQYTPKTKATLAALSASIETAARGAIQRRIDACGTHMEALIIRNEYAGLLRGQQSYTFQGAPMPSVILPNPSAATEHDPSNLVWHTPRQSRVLGRSDKTYAIRAHDIPDSVFVTGFNLGQFNAQHKRKLLAYAEQNNLTALGFNWFVLADRIPTSRWIPTDRVIQWSDVKAIKLATDARVGGRVDNREPGAYNAYVDGEFVESVQSNDINTTKPLFYVRGNAYAGRRYATVIGRFYPGATIACLPQNRVEKFKRTFPEAVAVDVGIRQKYDAWKDSLTDTQRLALTIKAHGDAGVLTNLDPSRVTDPELQRAIRAAKTPIDTVLQERRAFEDVMYTSDLTAGVKWNNPLRKYPLATPHSIARFRDHVYLYLNAAAPAPAAN